MFGFLLCSSLFTNKLPLFLVSGLLFAVGLAQGLVSNIPADSSRITYESIGTNDSSTNIGWEVGLLDGEPVAAATVHPSIGAKFTFYGSSILIYTNSAYAYPMDAAASANIYLDGVLSISNPPFVGDMIYNSTTQESNFSHTIVISKSQDSPESSILLVSSISVIALESGNIGPSKTAEDSTNSNSTARHDLPSDGVIVGLAIGGEIALSLVVCLAVQFCRRLHRKKSQDRQQIHPFKFKFAQTEPTTELEDLQNTSDASRVPHSGAPPPRGILKVKSLLVPLHSGGPVPKPWLEK
ncbi:hypothetical protein SCHPADRAFT_895124 [Schizopora paradoxa]|uniref:Uncharacterized protein n=1 Tax=Schizopora paradoxa TaxID=27342 RepID=A0A0H2R4S0_9AGAM|nr:hypothetical protein SCHPADRAFT_895124 [Schizopora paradoxa]